MTENKSKKGQVVKIRDIIKLIEADGWYHVDTKGSHRQYKHATKSGRVTIAGHPGGVPGTHDVTLRVPGTHDVTLIIAGVPGTRTEPALRHAP
jgi:predicted RNA binding protein YcfA (HicA-like mRNA interferase family)